MEGVDFDESFAPVAHMESIRVLLALACHLKFKLYQMNVKTAFLNGFLKEDVYVTQPKRFIDPHFPDHVLYLKKALYGLKQALELGMIGSHNIWCHMGSQEEKLIKLSSSKGKMAS